MLNTVEKKTKTTKNKNKLCKFWFTNLSAGIQQLNFWLAFLKHMAKVFILSFHIEKKILFTPRYTPPLRLKWMLEGAPMRHYLHSLTNPLFYECRHKTATFLKCIWKANPFWDRRQAFEHVPAFLPEPESDYFQWLHPSKWEHLHQANAIQLNLYMPSIRIEINL